MIKKLAFIAALSVLFSACGDSDDNSDNNGGNDTAVCGNGSVENGEECDDGNKTDGDGCSKDCKIEKTETAVCGNGKIETGEECDDGNKTDGDGCSKDCKIEKTETAVCGNGKIETGEECDDGNKTDGDGCSKDCKIEKKDEESGAYVADVKPNPGPETKCNDGKHEAGEVCDPIYNGQYFIDNVSRNCYKDETTGKCVLESVEGKKNCGNGILDDGEECDDGNTGDGDGCSRNCQNEAASLCKMKNGVVAKVLLVVDGDTLKIQIADDGTGCSSSKNLTVRMHGIDSPECVKAEVKSPISDYKAYSCTKEGAETLDGDKSQKGGYEAGEFVKSLVYSEENNGTVFVECETRGADDPTCLMDSTNYRYLAYIKLKKDGKDVDLAEETLKAGYAMAYTDFTSQRTQTYCAAEAQAIQNKAGVWSYAATAAEVITQYMGDKAAWFNAATHCN